MATTNKPADTAADAKTTDAPAADVTTADVTTTAAPFDASAFADTLTEALAGAIGAANAKVNAPRSITLPVAAPKDTSDRVVLWNGPKEALEVPANSAHILEGMGWARKGAKGVKPGMVTLTLPGFDGDPITVPVGQVGHLQSAGWVIKE